MGLSTKITGIAAVLIIAAILFFWNRDHSELRATVELQSTEITNLENWKEAAREKLTSSDTVYVPAKVSSYDGQAEFTQIDSMQVYYEIKESISGPVSEDTLSVVREPVRGLNRTYAGSFTTPDFKINWRLVNGPTGRLLDISSGEYEMMRREIRSNHLIEVEKEVPVEYRKNHLYLEIAAGNPGNKWTEWTSVDAYMMYLVKSRWGIGVGYQRWNSYNLYKIKVSLMLM